MMPLIRYVLGFQTPGRIKTTHADDAHPPIAEDDGNVIFAAMLNPC